MAWNVFKFCTALRGLGSIMIILVLGVVGVSYYAVVITNYGPALAAGGLNSLLALAVLLLFHFLLVMLLWCYFSVVFTDPGSVPSNWRPAMDKERGVTDPLTTTEFPTNSDNQEVRYCRNCNQLKPPRCHHCSVCEFRQTLFFRVIARCCFCSKVMSHRTFYFGGRCVLKMDHHCVWVVNCVGALNYKYFLLFLILLHSSAKEREVPGTPGTLATTFLAFVLNLAFALSVFGFLIMHISLVAANTTTIEAYEKKRNPRWRYDLGRKRNFEQVFGMDKSYWLIPAYSEEDLRRMTSLQGLEYPSSPDLDSQEL